MVRYYLGIFSTTLRYAFLAANLTMSDSFFPLSTLLVPTRPDALRFVSLECLYSFPELSTFPLLHRSFVLFNLVTLFWLLL